MQPEGNTRWRTEGRGAAPAVRVRLLGGFGVSVDRREVPREVWSLRKAASLVKLLSLAPSHALHREQIAEALWPNLGRRAISNNLRQVLHTARAALHPDPEISSRLLTSAGERILLCQEGELWVDAESFEEAAWGARRAREPLAYEAALDLYRGELLPEDRYEEWAEGPRARLREIHLSLLSELASLYEGQGEPGRAEAALGRLLVEEPTNEGANASLMRLYALSGRRAEALSKYGRLEAVLRRLGMEPSAPLRSLREEIFSGRYPPPDAPHQQRADEAGVSRGNLPARRSGFVGREREMVELKRELAMTRLLTLTGTAGSGKTRLALEVARDLTSVYPAGAWFVDLAPLSEPKLVPQAVAATLGVGEQPGQPLADTLADALSERDLLLILDNCEHLVEAVAALADVLLARCPSLRVLVTSREPLGVEGEVTWRVPPLSVPEQGSTLGAEGLRTCESSRLFLQRARARIPGFAPSSGDADAVAEICRRLEGLPLAIELAAARVAVLGTDQIRGMLGDSVELLSAGGGSWGATARQKTLRGTLDWSHSLLDKKERLLFGRLSVFAGSFALEAAEAVLPDERIARREILELLSTLVNKSLVVTRPAGEVIRYRLLEPVRQYAREKLEKGGEAEYMTRTHAEYFLSLAEEAEPELKGPDQVEWLGRLEAEHDNMRAALSWTLQHGKAELALGLGGALWSFWFRRGYYSEGRRWLEGALEIDGRRSPQSRVMALAGLGMLATQQGDVDRVQEACEEGLDLLAREGSEVSWAKIFLLSASGYAALSKEDYERGTRLYEGCLQLSREMRDDWAIAFSLFGLALVSHRLGDPERTAELYEESMDLFRELGDKFSLAFGLNQLGLVERSRGDLARAERLTEESVALLRELGAGGDVEGLCNLGWMALLREDLGKAADFYEEVLSAAWDIERNPIVTSALKGFACLAGAHGEAERAARLWGAAQALHEGKGVPWDADFLDFLAEADARISRARLNLGEEAWEEAWREGRAMTAEEAVRYAFPDKPAPPSDSTGPPTVARTGSLTPREREVAALVARGLTNRQIASELFISERTVTTHVGKILKKLRVHSREQIRDLPSARS